MKLLLRNLIGLLLGLATLPLQAQLDHRITYSTSLPFCSLSNGVTIPITTFGPGGDMYVVCGGTRTLVNPTSVFPSNAPLTSDGIVVTRIASGGTVRFTAFVAGVTSAGTNLAVDSVGNTYVGLTVLSPSSFSSAFPTSPGAYETSPGRTAWFKLSADGNSLLYSTFFNASGLSGIAADANGNAYLSGSWDGGTVAPAFIAKFDPTQSGPASLLYKTSLGGVQFDGVTIKAIAVDSSNNPVVAGVTSSANFPTTSNAFQQTAPACSVPNCGHTIVSKLSADGSTFLYSTYLGGNGSEFPVGLAIDLQGFAYIAGETASTNFPVVNAYQSTLAGDRDAFLTKIDTTASGGSSVVFSTYLGGSAQESVAGVAVDASGNVTVAGGTDSGDFPIVHPILGPPISGYPNSFVTTFRPTGTPLSFSTVFPLTWFDPGGAFVPTTNRFWSIATNSSGDILLSGQFGDLNTFYQFFPLTFGTLASAPPFLLRISPTPGVSLTTSRALIAFPAIKVQTSTALSLRPPPEILYNTGTTPLTLHLTTTGDFKTAVDPPGIAPVPVNKTCSSADTISLNPGDWCELQVQFTPTAVGTRTGSLNIFYGAPTPVVIPLSGFGLGNGAIHFNPGSITFPVTAANSSVSQLITMTNSGSGALQVSQIAVSGTDFSQINDCPASLPVGTACAIVISFHPTSAGTSQGTVLVTSDASATPATLGLGGSSLLAPAISAPQAIFFGTQATGTNSSPQPATITNSGSAPLNIVGLSISGDFSQTNNCITALQPGQSCTINVTFSPTSTGQRTGSISIDDNAMGHPHTITLIGGVNVNGGAAAAFVASSASVSVAAGQSASLDFQVMTSSTLQGLLTVSCSGAPAGSACTVTPPAFLTGPFKSTDTFKVLITTTAPQLGSARSGFSKSITSLLALSFPLMVLGFGRRRYRRQCGLILMILISVLWIGCGGGGGGAASTPASPTAQISTPPGTYNLAVTGTFSSGLQETTGVTLTVR